MNDIFKDQSIYQLLEERRENSIDIYEFYNVLYKLFEDLGVLADEHEQARKLSFKFGRPDEVYQNSQNTVILDLGERKYLEYNGRKQVHHRTTGEYRNVITGQQEEEFVISFQNEIYLSITSDKYEQLLRITEFLEDVIFKHRGRLEQKVEKVQYVKTSETIYHTNNASTKLQTKTIVLLVNTVKIYTKAKEIVQYIK